MTPHFSKTMDAAEAATRQSELPGTSADIRGLLRQRAAAPIKPRQPQQPCDVGLFSDDASQLDLVQQAAAPSPWEKRATPTGFLQFREGTWDRWRFQVYSFRDTSCTVYAADGKREVPIDAKGRILIEGAWYSRDHWNH